NCMFCGERIIGDLDAEFCAGCSGPRHCTCRGPDAQAGDGLHCSVCGAEWTPESERLTRPGAVPVPAGGDTGTRQSGFPVGDAFFGIPYALHYTATVRGQAPKRVSCEQCGT